MVEKSEFGDAKKFFTPASAIHVEPKDRDRYCQPYARDETPPPPGSCPYVGNKPFHATQLRVCKQGCTCTPTTFTDYADCPLYKNQARLDGVLTK